MSLAVCAAGCRDREQIEHYSVPRAAAPAASKDAMLGAIVSHEGQAWFFKISGPAEQVDQHAESFKTLIESIKFESGRPTWNLPAGWKEVENPVASGPGLERYKTLRLEESPVLDLAVTSLPIPQTDADEYMLANVNRWRGQMTLPPLTKADLPAQTASVATKDGRATLVSLVGRLKANIPGRGPFMGAGDGK
jgi:hypothetical protein